MKILYIAGREASYSRTHHVFKALTQNGFDVTGCFPPDRAFRHYPALLWKAFRRRKDCDIVLVGFYGQLILPFIRLMVRKPLIFDMYISTYDTMIHDRAAARPGSVKAWLYKLSDTLSCRLASRIILESDDHIRDFSQKFGVAPAKFDRIFLAVDDEVIYPLPENRPAGDPFRVHFHGEYAPFHGTRIIIDAARLLQDEDIEFQMVGRGITYEADREYAENAGIQNIRFVDPVPYADLAGLMARSDICLGIFGGNERMLRVTTNKVIESIAMKKPLITGRNAPVQELLTHKRSAYLVNRNNPRALADAILTLKRDADLARAIADQGYRVFLDNCTMDRLGQGLARVISRTCSENANKPNLSTV
jgi:glycosyltransferase involved in cell wall biosynthesis